MTKTKIINPQDQYIQVNDKHGHDNVFYMSKAHGRGECVSLCKAKDFPIAKLLTKSKTTATTAMTRFHLKHKQMGLARCRNCDYITANPVDSGARCPCCKNKFSRFIRTPRPGQTQPNE